MKAGNYTIKWTYFKRFRKPLAGEPVKPDQTLVYDGTDTHCWIEVNGMANTPPGSAHCTPTDIFCRDKGRKLSLARAIKNLSLLLSKEDKKMIWEAYRTMTTKPRW